MELNKLRKGLDEMAKKRLKAVAREAGKLQTQTRKNVKCPKCNSGHVRNKGRLGSMIYYRCNNCYSNTSRTATTFQVFFDRDLSTAFAPGEWAGKTVVIVGPHPRALDFDGKEFKGKPTIAIGAAWLLFAKYSLIPDLLISSFMRFVDRTRDNEEFNTWTNYKACPASFSKRAPNDWLTIEASKEHFTGNLKDGVSIGHDHITAVCIAASLGARSFDLVGFQLDGNDIEAGFYQESQTRDVEAIKTLQKLQDAHGLTYNKIA